MLFRLLRDTLMRRKKRVALAALAVVIGSSLATALLSVSADILDRFTREMRSYGANILLIPEAEALPLEIAGVSYSPAGSQQYIDEDELIKLKTIFWRNNITGLAPFLNVLATSKSGEPIVVTGTWFEKELKLPEGVAVATGVSETASSVDAVAFKAGLKPISPWWKVQGKWMADTDLESAIVGASVAAKMSLAVGDTFEVRYKEWTKTLRVSGIVSTGGYEDGQVFVALPVAQRLLGIPKGASRVLVSALTMPKEKLAPDIRNKRPEEMSQAEYEKWYCSPIIDAVVTQIKEVIPGVEPKPIRQMSEAEGAFAMKIQLLVLLVTTVALLTSALGVMTVMTATILERRGEIGLMKAIGAENTQIATIFLSEAAVIGVVGGALGYAGGYGLANYIGVQVFHLAIVPGPVMLPVSLVLAIGVALLGAAFPVRNAIKIEPVILLRGVGG